MSNNKAEKVIVDNEAALHGFTHGAGPQPPRHETDYPVANLKSYNIPPRHTMAQQQPPNDAPAPGGGHQYAQQPINQPTPAGMTMQTAPTYFLAPPAIPPQRPAVAAYPQAWQGGAQQPAAQPTSSFARPTGMAMQDTPTSSTNRRTEQQPCLEAGQQYNQEPAPKPAPSPARPTGMNTYPVPAQYHSGQIMAPLPGHAPIRQPQNSRYTTAHSSESINQIQLEIMRHDQRNNGSGTGVQSTPGSQVRQSLPRVPVQPSSPYEPDVGYGPTGHYNIGHYNMQRLSVSPIPGQSNCANSPYGNQFNTPQPHVQHTPLAGSAMQVPSYRPQVPANHPMYQAAIDRSNQRDSTQMPQTSSPDRSTHTKDQRRKELAAYKAKESRKAAQQRNAAQATNSPRKPPTLAKLVISSRTDSMNLPYTVSMAPALHTTLTSQPSFLPTHMDAQGNPVNLKSQRRTLLQVGGFGGADAPEKCMICRVKYGDENPHPAHGINIAVPGGGTKWVDINNLGSTEIAVRMHCGHVVGSNCITPYFFCPRCQGRLLYVDCGHKIPLQPVCEDLSSVVPGTYLHERCTTCRVKKVEDGRELQHHLDEAAKYQDLMERPGMQGEALANLQGRLEVERTHIAETERQTSTVISDARAHGYE